MRQATLTYGTTAHPPGQAFHTPGWPHETDLMSHGSVALRAEVMTVTPESRLEVAWDRLTRGRLLGCYGMLRPRGWRQARPVQ